MKAVVTVTGKDKTGIIAKVSSFLSEQNVNIEDISQTIMGEYFAMIMMVDVSGCKKELAALAEECSALGEKIGMKIRDLNVLDYNTIKDFVDKEKPTMAILSVPKAVVNQVAQDLIDCGIRAFLNFSYAEITSEENIVVENIHLGDSLMRLSYKISEKNNLKNKD